MDTRNARLGRKLFFVYLLLYTGFVLLTAINPDAMDRRIAGVNLAIWYGAALILAAVVLALVYGAMCDADDEPVARRGETNHVE